MGFNGSDRELLELILNQVTVLTMDMSGVKTDLSGVKGRLSGVESQLTGVESRLSAVESQLTGVESRLSAVESDLKDVKKTVVRIEHDHGEKLSVLFDGYKQNSEKLDRIEAEVAKHEEIILRRVR